MNLDITGLSERILQIMQEKLGSTPAETIALALNEFVVKRNLMHTVYGTERATTKLTNGQHDFTIISAERVSDGYKLGIEHADGPRFGVRLFSSSLGPMLKACERETIPMNIEEMIGRNVRVVVRGGKPSRFPDDDRPSLNVCSVPEVKTTTSHEPEAVVAVIRGVSEEKDGYTIILDGGRKLYVPTNGLSALLDATLAPGEEIESVYEISGRKVRLIDGKLVAV